MYEDEFAYGWGNRWMDNQRGNSERAENEQDVPHWAAGSLILDRLELGVEIQALAVTANVVDDPLASQFVGLMGLALPLNSIFAEASAENKRRTRQSRLARAGRAELMPLHADARGSLATTTRGDIHSLTDEELKNLQMHRPRVHDEQREGGDDSPAGHETSFTFANWSNVSAIWDTDNEANDDIAPVFTDFAAQQDIDSEIAFHTATLLDLRRKRNTLTAIYSLPDDILSLIFVTCRDRADVLDVPVLWRRIISVCSQWRHLALATPMFSNTIVLSDPRNVVSLLHHSVQTPLRLQYPLFHIVANGREESANAAFWSVLEEAQERLEQFSITCGNLSVAALDQVFDTCDDDHYAPFLQQMSLTYNGTPKGSVYILHHSLPWAFMPSLCHLELRDILVPADFPFLPTLTRLTLACNLSKGGGVPILYATKLLAQTPNIKVVTIEHIVKFRNSDHAFLTTLLEGPHKRPIPLPKLEELTVHSDWITGCEFLDYLRFPPSTRVAATFANFVTNTIGTSSFERQRFSALATLRSLLSTVVVHNTPDLSTQLNIGKARYRIRVSSPTKSVDSHSHSTRKIVDLCLLHQQDVFGIHDLLDILGSSQLKSTITKLRIYGGYPAGMPYGDTNEREDVLVNGSVRQDGVESETATLEELWSRVLPTFQSLESIHIEALPLSFLTTILGPSLLIFQRQQSHDTEDGAGDRIRNVALVDILTTSVDWYPPQVEADPEVDSLPMTATTMSAHPPEDPTHSEAHQVSGEENSRTERDDFAQKGLTLFIKTIGARRTAGIPLSQLTISDCTITPRQIRRLKNYIHVKWDGNSLRQK
ncbi:hypothetical protein ONZ45_g3429 [Pleurotus djamor]|nr:hypothetical protein ONZ45_g3429 [Pleurotus djamor]